MESLFEMFEGCLTLLCPLELCVLSEKFVQGFGDASKQWHELSMVTCQAQEISKVFHIAGFLYVLYG